MFSFDVHYDYSVKNIIHSIMLMWKSREMYLCWTNSWVTSFQHFPLHWQFKKRFFFSTKNKPRSLSTSGLKSASVSWAFRFLNIFSNLLHCVITVYIEQWLRYCVWYPYADSVRKILFSIPHCADNLPSPRNTHTPLCVNKTATRKPQWVTIKGKYYFDGQ